MKTEDKVESRWLFVGIRRFDFKCLPAKMKGQRWTCKHTMTKTEDKAESRRLVDGIRRFDFEGDCLAGQGLREDLDASKAESRRLVDGIRRFAFECLPAER